MQKMIGGEWGRPLLCEKLVDDDPPVYNVPIFYLFSSVTHQP